MGRFTFRYVFIAIATLIIFSFSYVFAQPEDHLGEICITCHQKYSDNTAITKFSPCAKGTCHDSNPTDKWGGRGPHNRYPLHTRKEVCLTCHESVEERFDMHLIHWEVENNCRICHMSLGGWNSSIAKVPAMEGLISIFGMEITIPKSKDCEYCHPSVVGARRMHDVHEPVIEETCKDCHGSGIESRPDLIAEITGKPLQIEVETKKERLVVKEFSMLFDEIAQQMSDFYDFLKI